MYSSVQNPNMASIEVMVLSMSLAFTTVSPVPWAVNRRLKKSIDR